MSRTDTFPPFPYQPDPEERHESRSQLRMYPPQTRTVSLLLIEDNPDDATLLARTLLGSPGHNFKLSTAARLSEALDLLPGGFDLILLDFVLPDSHGLDAFAAVHDKVPDVPIVLLSGLDNESLAVEALSLGAQDYLVKGRLDRDLLVRSIRYAIERKRIENENSLLLAEVESQRERLERIVGTVPGVVWEAWGNPAPDEQRIDFVSGHVETMLGYSVEEWLSTPNFWLALVHPDDREEASRLAGEQFRSGEGGINRFRWITKAGRVLWCEAQATVIKDAIGRPLGMRGVTIDVTERVRLEEQVRSHAESVLEEYERLATLIANVDIGIVMMDARGRLVLVNDAWLRRGNLVRNDVIGRRYEELGDIQTMRRAQVIVDRVLVEGNPVVIRDAFVPEATEQHPDGIYIDWSLQPVHGAGGEITGLLAVSVDVTEKVRARQQVENQRILLETAIASIPIGIVYYDREMRILNANTIWEKMSGFQAESTLGKTIYELFPQAEARRQVYERVLTGEHIDEENRLIPGYGTSEPRYFDVGYRPLKDADGSIIGIISTITDVHDRVKATQNLQQQKVLLDTIFQSAPVGLALFDRDMRYLNVNAEYAAMSRHKVEDLKGNVLYDVAPEALARKPVHDHVLAGQDVNDENIRVQHPDGSVSYYDLLYRAVRDASGAVTGVLNTVVEVTERKQLEQQKDDFIALASHELKTPVTAIKGNAQVAARMLSGSGAEPQNERLSRVLNTINSQSDRLTRLINDLLDMSRVDRTALALHKERFDLRDLVRETVDDIEMAAPDFVFNMELPGEPCMVNADRQRIEQVLINLLQNAVKYTIEEKRVDVQVSRQGNQVSVQIRGREISTVKYGA